MNPWLVVKLDESLNVVGIDKAKSDGLAHQRALVLTDQGFRCKVIDPDDSEEVLRLYGQVEEKRDKGFVNEYGHVPNGLKKHEGARTIGNMIFPAFGGMLESQVETKSTRGDRTLSDSLPLSSSEPKTVSQKFILHLRKDGVN